MSRRIWSLIGLALFFCTKVYSLSAAVFYGEKAPLTELCSYDIAIVDPRSDVNPKDYCTSMSQPFAYVSVGEVDYDSPYLKQVRKSWVIGRNKDWDNNVIIDQTNKDWQKFLLDQIIEPLWQKGYHGFFFDTMDSYYLARTTTAQEQEQEAALISIIHQLKLRHPEVKIILNRGFPLLEKVRGDIYAVMIESLYNAWNQEKKIYEETSQSERKILFKEIEKIRALGLPIIIVDYLSPSQKAKAPFLASALSKQGFIPWITDAGLTAIYIKKFQKFPREILILFNNAERLTARFEEPLWFVAPILEYFGYVPKYINIHKNSALPEGDLTKEYAGIILWLDVKVDDSVFSWVLRQIKAHIPVVFLISFGAEESENPIFDSLELQLGTQKSPKVSLEPTYLDPNYVGYEVQPSKTPYDFIPLRTKSGKVLLQMASNVQLEDAVALTPWGGYALDPYVVQYYPNSSARWVINPFKFFTEALRLKDFPVPDTTTENGRRLMSVHVDGDGFSYPAKWMGGGLAGAELRDRVLSKFQIPTSISVITGEIAKDPNNLKPGKKLIEIARSIFKLPWVEVASHSYSHPFYWEKQDEKYAYIGEFMGIYIPDYKFNLVTEINGSVDFINKNLAPENKPCKLYFWSGLGDPSEEALALTYKAGLLNINGVPDTNISKKEPSITAIMPKGINIGGYYQVFAPIDMDFNYTDGFLSPLNGFEKVIQTFNMTDKPRRFKPIDLYYHFYSAINPASIEALINVYEWALLQPVINIYISEYIKKVIDYYEILISKRDNSWLIFSNGDLRELRVVKALGYPDLESSQNVIGFKENENDIYVHLGPSRVSRLVFKKTKPELPYLVDANAFVTGFSRKDKELTINFHGYRPLKFSFANVKACRVNSKKVIKLLSNENQVESFSSEDLENEVHFSC